MQRVALTCGTTLDRIADNRYSNTEQISLISSYMCSLLLGDYAAIDTSDGAGMNLMDLRKQAWAPKALNATAKGLADKLIPVVPGHTVLGEVAGYFVSKYAVPLELLTPPPTHTHTHKHTTHASPPAAHAHFHNHDSLHCKTCASEPCPHTTLK
jgi:hypothetical protein